MKQTDPKPKLIVDLSKTSKLKGFVVIDNDNLGPALGGTRIADYESEEYALADAMKLAHAMTYKCAIASMPFGGGKGVIIKSADMSKEEMLKEYAEQIDKLNGKFHTGEDVGLEEKDVQYMLKFSPYFIGKTGQAGDPSYFAALSTFNSIKVAFNFLYKTDKIAGRSFAVKGVGKTGFFLAKLLALSGGKVFLYDPNQANIRKLLKLKKNIIKSETDVTEMEVDVFCPCDLGNDVTEKNVEKIKARIIAGTANNQLESRRISQILFDRGILHVPDYIANAGGLVDVADELQPGGYDRRRVLREIDNLKKTLLSVLNKSKKTQKSPLLVADELAEKFFLKKKETVYAR